MKSFREPETGTRAITEVRPSVRTLLIAIGLTLLSLACATSAIAATASCPPISTAELVPGYLQPPWQASIVGAPEVVDSPFDKVRLKSNQPFKRIDPVGGQGLFIRWTDRGKCFSQSIEMPPRKILENLETNTDTRGFQYLTVSMPDGVRGHVTLYGEIYEWIESWEGPGPPPPGGSQVMEFGKLHVRTPRHFTARRPTLRLSGPFAAQNARIFSEAFATGRQSTDFEQRLWVQVCKSGRCDTIRRRFWQGTKSAAPFIATTELGSDGLRYPLILRNDGARSHRLSLVLTESLQTKLRSLIRSGYFVEARTQVVIRRHGHRRPSVTHRQKLEIKASDLAQSP